MLRTAFATINLAFLTSRHVEMKSASVDKSAFGPHSAPHLTLRYLGKFSQSVKL